MNQHAGTPQSWNFRIETDRCTLLVSGFARTAFEATARAYRMARVVCPDYADHRPYLHSAEQLANPYAAAKVLLGRHEWLARFLNKHNGLRLPLAGQGCPWGEPEL